MAKIRLSLQEADGLLPDVCMCCGEPATVTKTKEIFWHPLWVAFFALLTMRNPARALSSGAAHTRKAVIQAPFCRRHKWHWSLRYALLLVTFLLWMLLSAGGIYWIMEAPDQSKDQVGRIVMFSLGGVFLAWVVLAMIVRLTAIRATEITDDEIALTGVHEDFVSAVMSQRKTKRRVSKRGEDHDD